LSTNSFSEKSDIWALGVTVYELLLGKVPWGATTEKELAKNMMTIPPSIPSNVSEDCRDFILRCLAVDPLKRWTIEDMEQHSWIKKKKP